MGRGSKGRSDPKRPVDRVERIELSQTHIGLRLGFVILFLVIAVSAFAYGISTLFTADPGWQTVEASTSAAANNSGDFTFLYELGAGDQSATAEKRALVNVYTEAAVTAYRLFSADESFEGVTNVYDLNQHPNETLTVDGALYEAFGLLERYGDRSVYLGPVYELYNDLFFCQEDWQTQDFDPYVNPVISDYYMEVAAYAKDRSSVQIELLGDHQVRLRVSEEYLAFAQDNGTSRFIDFSWLTNAFIADYLAETLAKQGYTHGSLSSYDGFVRNLDSRELDYAMNLYDFADGSLRPAGVMNYRGPRGMVYLRDYPLNEEDGRRMYRLKTGEIRTNYLSTGDGRCKSAVHDLIAYSDTMGCAEIALRIAPIYVADSLDAAALEALAASGIQSIRMEDRVIRGTDAGLTLTDLYEGEDVRYTASLG